jgi:hypothetical protein
MANQMGSLEHAPVPTLGEAANWPDLPKSEVLAELDRILESHHFRTSKKCSRFLRHIVEACLDGRVDCLKERTLGVDVFHREPHYDTNQDPIVRGTAGEVRKRLAQYYVEAPSTGLRLTLPPGSYVPEVHTATADPPKAREAPPWARKRFDWMSIAAASAALCGLTTCVWLVIRPTSVDRFWAPVTAGKNVLVCMGQPQLYTFKSDTARVLNSWFEAGKDNQGTPPTVAPVPLNQVVPMWDSSVALSDAQAFGRLAHLLAKKKVQVDLRGERSVSLSDLRGKPSVLIGAYDNEWTLSLAADLRFYFDTDERAHTQIIRDKQNPKATDWKLVDAWPPGRDINKDYALVTRVVNRTTERPVVILGGIAQYGTQAAAEFVTQPSYFDQVLAHAPADWDRKNMQMVISTRVLAGVSGPPTLVAAYFW